MLVGRRSREHRRRDGDHRDRDRVHRTIVNQDASDHTFTITGTQIDVPIAAGETFNGEPISGAVSPGTYDFLCTIHPTMTGQVTIIA